jgi:hypothetical protein
MRTREKSKMAGVLSLGQYYGGQLVLIQSNAGGTGNARLNQPAMMR